MNSKNITIIIPTKNRSEFVLDLVNYYHLNGYQGDLLILDASDEEDFIKLQKILNKFRNVKVLHTPDDYFLAIYKSIGHIKTKYVACSGDDDFFFIYGLTDCKNFLEKNDNFSSVSGLGLLAKYDATKRKIKQFSIYHINDYIHSSKGERLKSIIKNYSVLNFCLHRSSLFKKAFFHIPDNIHNSKFEILNSFSLILNGKIGKVKSFYLLRLTHNLNKKHFGDLDYYNENFQRFFKNKIYSQISEKFRLKKINQSFFSTEFIKILKQNHKKNFIKHILNVIFLRIKYPEYLKLIFLKKKEFSFKEVNLISKIVN